MEELHCIAWMVYPGLKFVAGARRVKRKEKMENEDKSFSAEIVRGTCECEIVTYYDMEMSEKLKEEPISCEYLIESAEYILRTKKACTLK